MYTYYLFSLFILFVVSPLEWSRFLWQQPYKIQGNTTHTACQSTTLHAPHSTTHQSNASTIFFIVFVMMKNNRKKWCAFDALSTDNKMKQLWQKGVKPMPLLMSCQLIKVIGISFSSFCKDFIWGVLSHG